MSGRRRVLTGRTVRQDEAVDEHRNGPDEETESLWQWRTRLPMAGRRKTGGKKTETAAEPFSPQNRSSPL